MLFQMHRLGKKLPDPSAIKESLLFSPFLSSFSLSNWICLTVLPILLGSLLLALIPSHLFCAHMGVPQTSLLQKKLLAH